MEGERKYVIIYKMYGCTRGDSNDRSGVME